MANKRGTSQQELNHIISESEKKEISQMVKTFNSTQNMELEVSFKNIDYTNFMRISEHYVEAVDTDNISGSDVLDVSVQMADGNIYRVGFKNPDLTSLFLEKFKASEPRSIITHLFTLRPNDDYEIMLKNRGSATFVRPTDIPLSFKLVAEDPITSKNVPKFTGREKLRYRYKQRYSFQLNANTRLDLTTVQEATDIWRVQSVFPKYEVEVEATSDKITYDTFMRDVADVLRVVQKSDHPIGITETKAVLRRYQTLLGLREIGSHLAARNVVSLEKQHIVKYVANKYTCTDKADGDRYFLVIIETGTYLISTNLTVQKMDMPLKTKKTTDAILDGEYVVNESGRMFLVFDVVYANGVNYYSNAQFNLVQRITIFNSVVDAFFGTVIPFPDYEDSHTDFELNAILKFYSSELKTYWRTFRKTLAKATASSQIFVTRKLYFVPYGIDSAEIFMYANMLWKLEKYADLPPYKLDGIIYTPINYPYMIKVNYKQLDDQPVEYKWKIPSQNSIDFYVKFEFNTQGVESVYFDAATTTQNGEPYKICNLYVGSVTYDRNSNSSTEKPVPFLVNGIHQKANIYLADGEARDVEGNIISDGTVVEFVYDATRINVNDSYKWIALRTRYDKTESVKRTKKRYGNNTTIASRIWRTIENPITEEIIATLANPSTYQSEINRLAKSTTNVRQESFVYYQKKTQDSMGMRAFNNWIKTNMIQTYCKSKPSVLDIGCGRGGDLIKFGNAHVGEYVGVDIDYNGLFGPDDSAINRYTTLRKQMKNFPPMHFINADARGLFNSKVQANILPAIISTNSSNATISTDEITIRNRNMIDKYLNGKRKYSVINCQFSIHYYLSDELSWSNFCKNINDHLADNGHFLVTCFDGDLIYDILKSTPTLNVSYTDNYGKKNTFFEIKKIYDDKTESKTIGMAIDLYNSLISDPGFFIREYLVFPEFIKESLHKNVGLDLVESDLFVNMFNLYRQYFTQETVPNLELTDISAKRYQEIRNFYTSLQPNAHTDVNINVAIASYKFAMLNRFFVFKKTRNIDISNPSRVVGVAQQFDLGKTLIPYFDAKGLSVDPSIPTTSVNTLYRQIRNSAKKYNPSIFLIRHTIETDSMKGGSIKRNRFHLVQLKQGKDPKTALIYKSPENVFYPIHHTNSATDMVDLFEESRQSRINRAINVVPKFDYLIDNSKIIDELHFMIDLSERFNM